MPIYEYKCDNDHAFEAFQSMAEDPLDVCEVCGAPARRVLSAPAVHFKGSGFYTTDYARKGKGKPSSDGGGEGKSESKGEKKAESKGGSDSAGKSEARSKEQGARS